MSQFQMPITIFQAMKYIDGNNYLFIEKRETLLKLRLKSIFEGDN